MGVLPVASFAVPAQISSRCSNYTVVNRAGFIQQYLPGDFVVSAKRGILKPEFLRQGRPILRNEVNRLVTGQVHADWSHPPKAGTRKPAPRLKQMVGDTDRCYGCG